MNRNRRVSVVCRVALPVLVAFGTSLLSASAAEFKATVSYRTPEQTESFPISVKGSKSRIDRTMEGRQTVILVDQESGTVQALDVQERKYGHFPLVSFPAALLGSLPSIIGVMAAQPGVETKLLGTETVSGYSCEKFAIVSKDDSTFTFITYWVSQKLNFPLKIDVNGGTDVELTRIQQGPVDETVFQVPSGYTLAETSGPPEPPMPDWVREVPAAPVVKPPHQQRMSAGEIIRVKVEAGQETKVSGEGETENQEDATFTAVAFRSGKPTQDSSYRTSTASKDSISTFGFDDTPQDADEIVVRVNKGVVLIEVKQEGPAEETAAQVRSLPVEQWQVESAPVVRPPHQQRMSAGEIIRVKVEAGKKIVVGGQAEGEETALFMGFPFRGGKPLPNVNFGESSDHFTAFADRITYQVFYWTPEEADEIVIRVDQGVVLIEVKQGLEEMTLIGECPDLPELPDLPDWVQEVPSAPVVTPPHQQRMSAGEIIRVKVEAGKQIDVSGKGETENPEDANFNLVPFCSGKPVEVPDIYRPPGSEPYPTYPAIGSPVHLTGESQSEQGADEIVVRVNKGVVLIKVKQCAFEAVVRRYCPGWPD